MSVKTCSKCGETKPLDGYYRNKPSPQGRRPDCKACVEAQHKIYLARPEVRARARAYHKKYNANLSPGQRKRYAAKSADWCKKTPRQLFALTLNGARQRRLSPDMITLDELMDLWKQQDGLCAVTRLKMTWRQGRIMPTSISLDRIDNNRGYQKDNVRLICWQINAFKGRMTDDDMYSMALAIVSNMRPKLRLVS